MLTAIVQAAMATFQDRFLDGAPLTDLKEHCIEENRWKAMRFGLKPDIIDPATLDVISMRDQVRAFLDFVAPKANELGSSEYIDRARELIDADTESEWQVARLAELDGEVRVRPGHVLSIDLRFDLQAVAVDQAYGADGRPL